MRDWLFLLMRYSSFYRRFYSSAKLRAKSSKTLPVNTTIIGLTFEERELFVVKIGPEYAPKMVLECGIHGREWLSGKWCSS